MKANQILSDTSLFYTLLLYFLYKSNRLIERLSHFRRRLAVNVNDGDIRGSWIVSWRSGSRPSSSYHLQENLVSIHTIIIVKNVLTNGCFVPHDLDKQKYH